MYKYSACLLNHPETKSHLKTAVCLPIEVSTLTHSSSFIKRDSCYANIKPAYNRQLCWKKKIPSWDIAYRKTPHFGWAGVLSCREILELPLSLLMLSSRCWVVELFVYDEEEWSCGTAAGELLSAYTLHLSFNDKDCMQSPPKTAQHQNYVHLHQRP